jgi:hypothetical protein
MASSTLPQTTFPLYPTNSVLGQLYRTAGNTENIKVYPALVACVPGDLLEKLYDATTTEYCVRPAQSANGALLALAGVAIYKSAKGGAPGVFTGASTPGTYQPGEMVSFCRRGQIFAKWLSADGTTGQVPFTVPNYAHSTTTVGNSQGAFTDKATASTAGSEVDACPAGFQLQEDQTGVKPNGTGLGQAPGFGTCLVAVNLP